ncbi:hypothetical protein [Hymenobacter siberiensis]|uniref:hypothetical protein n=1 Tax=Hymenobacter siberiensis TaxID=2848396 RepID=UPI001C1E56BE|nr:hypothetical protein [Hymenobacter siberiensis]MBU6120727.1 hypothetical protein [Hymenobacter siberiensis]
MDYSTQLLEIIVIAGLIAWQAYVFWQNRQLIGRIAETYPSSATLAIGPESRVAPVPVAPPAPFALADTEVMKRLFAGTPFVAQAQPRHWLKAQKNDEFTNSTNQISFALLVYVDKTWTRSDATIEYFDGEERRTLAPDMFSGVQFMDWLRHEPVRPVAVSVPVPAAPTVAATYDAVQAASDASVTFREIVLDTNEYLLNNHGAAADFGILKDISERHAEALDEEIQSRVSTPLYLGLLGTFLGAIMGLSTLVGNPFAKQASAALPQGSSFSDRDVQHFLGGVLIAMVGSLFGLGFTLWSNHLLQKARVRRDKLKNAYYTFLQKALLPKLNTDMQTGMASLQAVLNTFNEKFFGQMQSEFFTKISEFTPFIAKITENIAIQKSFLEKLQTIGYTQLANSTIKIFDRMDESAHTFEKFLGYQQALNVAVTQGADVARTITALLNRLTTLEKSLNSVPGYLESHDTNLRNQVAVFSEHQQLLADLGAGVRQQVSEGARQMDEALKARLKELDAESTQAHARWKSYFDRLNDDNLFERLSKQLDPFRNLPEQQQALNKLQERQAQASAQALQALEARIAQDAKLQQGLLEQVSRTNQVLEEITRPNLIQRWLGKK